MPELLSHRQTILMMDYGTGLMKVQGFSDDDPPVELPDIPLLDETFGQDGTMYALGTSMQGGEVTVHLGPSSPTAVAWIRLLAQAQQGAVIEWNGTYDDVLNNYSTKFSGGFLKSGPPGITPGKNNDFVFVFEQITPHLDNADFSPPPTYDI